MDKSNKNVLIFGESGSGKSSVVNLLLGQCKAEVSDKAIGCTFEFQKYETHDYNLYDTVGLSEGNQGKVKHEFAIKQLIKLLVDLEDGISLLILVIEKGRIKDSLNENYKLFVDTICMAEVPVLLVITHCEMDTIQGRWWEENKEYFENYGMNFNAVVSGSALQPTSVPEIMQSIIKDLNEKTVTELHQAIAAHLLTEPWKVKGGWKNWLGSILRKVISIIGRFFNIPALTNFVWDTSIEGRLSEYFRSQGFDTYQAHEMATHIANHLY